MLNFILERIMQQSTTLIGHNLIVFFKNYVHCNIHAQFQLETFLWVK